MRNFLLCFCLLFGASLFAQQLNISGTVSDSSGPLPGASVLVKGSSKGYVTDFDGKYNLKANKGDVLVFSYIGMENVEVTVSDSTTIDVTLQEDSEALEEVVVTSLGVKKTQRSIGYAQSEVKGGDLTMAKETDVVASMAGKVAGLQILGGPGSTFRNAVVRVRGVNSLQGGTAQFVVDGTFVESSDDVNMDDVETLSVLRGPAAVALYGSRGANGIVLITTKSGRGIGGWGVSINQNTTFDQVARLPEYQNEYAGGYSQTRRIYVDKDGRSWNNNTSSGEKFEVLQFGADESWGPKMDGRLYRPWWTWFKDDEENYGKKVPLVARPNNVKDFFEIGMTANTNISLSKTGKKYSARVSYTNVISNGIIPNSKMYKNYFSTNLKYDLSDHLSVNTSFTYKKNLVSGRPGEGYSGSVRANVMQMFNQWFQRQLDIEKLKNYKNKDGTLKSWNMQAANDPTPAYWNSPYFDLYENVPVDDTKSVYGFVELSYKFNDHFKISGFARTRNNSKCL